MTDAAAEPAPVKQRRDPGRTREQILQAAIAEFAENGVGGARIDVIAARAGANKRMIYHYFGGKEDLFLAVLERVYEGIRRLENEMRLEMFEPIEAMRRLVSFTFRYFVENQHFISLLNTENLHKAQHIRRSSKVASINYPLVESIGALLDRGAAAGVFRHGVDPVQLYISIAGLSYFYFSNIHTLSTIFARDLLAGTALAERERHVIEVILSYLRP